MDIISYALSHKYTDESIAGVSGVLKGANCEIESIVPIEGGNRITFKWKHGDLEKTDYLDVMDGKGSGTEGYTKEEIDNLLIQKLDKENPNGTGSFSLNRMANTSVADYSFAEGYNCEASGIASHAEGNSTVTNNYAEHAEGSYNKSTPSTNSSASDGTLHSVGIGNSMVNRKNAFEIMQNGDAYLLGVGNYDGTNPTEANTIQDIINNKDVVFISVPAEEIDGLLDAKVNNSDIGVSVASLVNKKVPLSELGIEEKYYLIDITTR